MPRSTCREARKHIEDKHSQKGVSTNAKMIDHHHFLYLHDASPCRSQTGYKSALQHGEGTPNPHSTCHAVAHLEEVDRADSMNRTRNSGYPFSPEMYPSTSVPLDDLDLVYLPTRNVSYWLVGNPLPRRTHAYLSGDGHGAEARASEFAILFTTVASCWQLPRYLVWGKIYLGKMGGWMGGLPLVCSSKRRKGSLPTMDLLGYNGFVLWCAVINGIVSVSANSNNAVAPSRCLQLHKLGKDGNDKVFKGVGYLAFEETKPSEPISGYAAKELELSLGSARNNRASCKVSYIRDRLRYWQAMFESMFSLECDSRVKRKTDGDRD
ncbi:hypothetical protein GE21DRAFT_1324836 [Neurospora crassa]|nr:hypothetical protein GE21DRAFT_1324836 [Neurospora crassa]